jgi:hypothetical protein
MLGGKHGWSTRKMAKKNLVDQVSDTLGVPETIKCDNVLKWDGSKLYVTEEVYRAGHKVRTQERDVTAEVADHIRRVLGA